uniref:Methionine aminopeptidase 2 n=1 Tax=Dermatophagoides pteronyssinus TaxID=6956 RepID=A0A6P6YBG6_DERPT|nr:methionine aminopeptidase 2B-like [Dermatophagoides pteronyssinus]
MADSDRMKLRLLGEWKETAFPNQDAQFSVPIDKQYKKNEYPTGVFLPYNTRNNILPTVDELREQKVIKSGNFSSIRRAAEAHKQTRKFAQSIIKPGLEFLEFVQKLEAKSKKLISAKGLKSGWGFPTGVSLNECAAHYTPNYGDPVMKFSQNSIVKVDFGVHVDGYIIDSAFSVAFDEKFDPLIQATKEATAEGVKMAGIDQCIDDIGASIEEIISSFEMEVGGKMVPIKPIENLSGHNIEPYRIHAKKSVPLVQTYNHERMHENEIYAIETFATTGSGTVVSAGTCSHYSLNYDMLRHQLPGHSMASARQLLREIHTKFGTLPFCRRWLDDFGMTKHLLPLKALVMANIALDFPPLNDVYGSFTSQTEHTILLHKECKEVLSMSDDY